MAAVGTIVGVVGFLLLLFGSVGIVRPSLFRVERRRRAVAIWSLWLPLLATGIALDPPPAKDGDPTPTETWIASIVIWGLCFGAGWLVARYKDHSRQTIPAQTSSSADESAALSRIAQNVRSRAAAPAAEPAPTPMPTRSQRTADVFRSAKPSIGKRTSRPKAPSFVPSDDDLNEAEVNRTTTLRFDYVDSNGVCSEREVINWIDTHFYVKGVCTSRRAMRTFRKDQIESWISGDDALKHGTLAFGRVRY